jgi:hypothetical protein
MEYLTFLRSFSTDGSNPWAALTAKRPVSFSLIHDLV